MFKKIGRFAKKVGLGAVKGLLPNIASEFKSVEVSEIVKSVRNAENSGDISRLKRELYNLFDLIDDGKLNKSYDANIVDKMVETLAGLIASGTTIWLALQGLGLI